MTANNSHVTWTAAEWHGRMLIDSEGEKIGKLQDVYVDVETDRAEFATVKEGFLDRHLTFVPLAAVQIDPDDLRIAVTKEQVRSGPELALHGDELSQQEEAALYRHFKMNYVPSSNPSGRRLARR